jgi:hypothetical protein
MFVPRGENMIKTASHPLAVASAIAVVTIGVLTAPAAASAHWSCGRSAPPDVDTSGNHRVHYNTTAVARVGSSTRCAIAHTYIFYSELLDYHCYAIDIDRIHTWTYVVTVGGEKRGWVNDGDLRDHGSTIRCPGDTDSGHARAATKRVDKMLVPAQK